MDIFRGMNDHIIEAQRDDLVLSTDRARIDVDIVLSMLVGAALGWLYDPANTPARDREFRVHQCVRRSAAGWLRARCERSRNVRLPHRRHRRRGLPRARHRILDGRGYPWRTRTSRACAASPCSRGMHPGCISVSDLPPARRRAERIWSFAPSRSRFHASTHHPRRFDDRQTRQIDQA